MRGRMWRLRIDAKISSSSNRVAAWMPWRESESLRENLIAIETKIRFGGVHITQWRFAYNISRL
jgi:hypothetical protein